MFAGQDGHSQGRSVLQPGRKCFPARTEMSSSQDRSVFQAGHACFLAKRTHKKQSHFSMNYDKRPRKNYDWIGFWNESWDVCHNSLKSGVLKIAFLEYTARRHVCPGQKTHVFWLAQSVYVYVQVYRSKATAHNLRCQAAMFYRDVQAQLAESVVLSRIFLHESVHDGCATEC